MRATKRQILFGGRKLQFDAILPVIGDSQARGTADDQSAAGFANNGHIWIANVSGVFVPYTPGVSGGSGLNFAAEDTGIGPELGFAMAFMAKYPTSNLYIIKDTASGSFQSIGTSTGTANVTIANPNALTVNSGSVPSNTVLTGAGIVNNDGKTLYSPFSGFVSPVNGVVNANVTSVSNVTATKYNGTISWSSANGLTYNGNSNNINNGVRARTLNMLTKLANPKIICVSDSLGTNDAAQSTTASTFQAEELAFVARMRADLPLSQTPIIRPRVMSAPAASATVRAAQAALSAADPLVMLIDMDAQPISADGTHWRQAGLNYEGAQAFALCGI